MDNVSIKTKKTGGIVLTLSDDAVTMLRCALCYLKDSERLKDPEFSGEQLEAARDLIDSLM